MKIVLDMADRRPIWDMPKWVPDRIRAALPRGWALDAMEDQAALPRGWSLQVMTSVNEGSADGAARIAPELLAAVEDAGAYLG